MLKIIACSMLISLSLFGAKPVKVTPNVTKITSVEGQAFLKTREGDIKTCASENVYLYSKEDYRQISTKIKEINGAMNKVNVNRLYIDSYLKSKSSFEMDLWTKKLEKLSAELKSSYPQLDIHENYSFSTFLEDIRKAEKFEDDNLNSLYATYKPILQTQCDSGGNFNLKNVPFAEYGLITRVLWRDGKDKLGGTLGKEISVDKQLQRILITERI